MTVLTVNTGSSSVRLAAFVKADAGIQQIASAHLHTNGQAPQPLLRAFLRESGLADISVISHRVVQGGLQFVAPCILNAEVEQQIEHLAHLAPLHNPLALHWMQGCREVLGNSVPQVAVFDTAFYADLPRVATTYALPRDLCEKYGIRRFGFHGIAHQAMHRRWRQLNPGIKEGGRVISLQLGSGCSITAVRDGKPQDTSMGFSPLEGLVMATRCGDMDAGLLTYLQRVENLSAQDLDELLNYSSGLRGISGSNHDMRELLQSDSPTAKLAVELFCYRARKYIGAYLVVLGGADVILFGGGIGENAAKVRERILYGLEWCGVQLDKTVNDTTIVREVRISRPESRVEVWVVPTDEAMILAQEAAAIIY